ncbi:hypothetical protein L3Q82_010111 [Scortum barcoo]|uniref:Uncharacterized protein n=1 Tax=Scortum barcoo TaxID=214431 RepID=A0ACB8WBT8_9TELE|nr:hypothetical protein L3Q82_010111 [Scortum barcoo]
MQRWSVGSFTVGLPQSSRGGSMEKWSLRCGPKNCSVQAMSLRSWTVDAQTQLKRPAHQAKAVGLTCSEPVRLVGGASRCAGTLEVKRGDWRPVYGPDWTLKTAAVVCRELDCGSAVSQAVREKPQKIWDISSSCVESGYGLRECVSSSHSSYITEITCLEPVRLVGGASRCAGTLEVKRGDWRPVYGPDWTLKTAAVVCRELDCGSAVSIGIRNESSYKSTWEISSSCVESGYALRECVSPSSFSSSIEITCSGKPISDIIHDSKLSRFMVKSYCDMMSVNSVRLVNGTSLCSGRLEVKFNQSGQLWSSMCEDDFDLQDAEVVCRELHCGAPSVLQGGLYGEVEPPMWAEEFQCAGNESALLDCRRSDSAEKTCSPGKAVGLTCSEPVRLVGGASRCAGILEVKRGDWREVRGSYWTLASAALICRKLDCGFAASTRIREDSSKRLTLRISSDCVQSGSALRECATLSWSSSVLELTCSDPAGFIRLVVLSLTLLLFIIVICFTHKASRGQKPGPQQNTELDYYNVGVCTVEGGSAEKKGAQAAE